MENLISITPRDQRFREGSSFCRMWFGCRQPSGDVRNSETGISAVKNTGFTDAAAWVNPGYLTVGAASSDYAALPAGSGQDFNLATHTLVFSLRLKKTAPAATETILTSYDTAGGLKIAAYNSGQLQFAAKALDNTALTINVSSANAVTLDGNEHVCTFFVPRDAVSARWCVDTKTGTTGNGGINGKDCSGGNPLLIGASTLAGFAKLAQFASIQMYAVPKDLAAINAEQVHGWISRNPHLPVPDAVF